MTMPNSTAPLTIHHVRMWAMETVLGGKAVIGLTHARETIAAAEVLIEWVVNGKPSSPTAAVQPAPLAPMPPSAAHAVADAA